MKEYFKRHYIPLDTLLDVPQVRALRAMRHFDWISIRELGDALDDHDENRQISLARAVKKLIAKGHVERRERNAQRYRITESGRTELQRLLDLALVGDASRSA